jgi:outer membrane protein OmpA-like peptidoglycan-associated protein
MAELRRGLLATALLLAFAQATASTAPERQLKRSLYFAGNSSNITEYSSGVLGRLAPDLANELGQNSGSVVLLVSATQGNDLAAVARARERAGQVRNELVRHGIAAARVEVQTAALAAEKGKPAGRVEVWLLTKPEHATAAAPTPVAAVAAEVPPPPPQEAAAAAPRPSAPAAKKEVPWWLSDSAAPPIDAEALDAKPGPAGEDRPPPPLPPLPPELAALDPPAGSAAPTPRSPSSSGHASAERSRAEVAAAPTVSPPAAAPTQSPPARPEPIAAAPAPDFVESPEPATPPDYTIPFSASSRDLSPPASDALDHAAEELLAPLQAHPDWTVDVLGVAQAREYNAPQSLAQARAALARLYLSTRGLQRSRLHLDTHVTARESDPGARVELRLIKP